MRLCGHVGVWRRTRPGGRSAFWARNCWRRAVGTYCGLWWRPAGQSRRRTSPAAAEEGDEGCEEILGHAARFVGDAIGLVRRLLDPDVVVLGGGLMNSEKFANVVFAAVAQSGVCTGGLSVVRARLGADSVVMGGMRLLAGPEPSSWSRKGEL